MGAFEAIIVVGIVLVAVAFLATKFTRMAKGSEGCGSCGCGTETPDEDAAPKNGCCPGNAASSCDASDDSGSSCCPSDAS